VHLPLLQQLQLMARILGGIGSMISPSLNPLTRARNLRSEKMRDFALENMLCQHTLKQPANT